MSPITMESPSQPPLYPPQAEANVQPDFSHLPPPPVEGLRLSSPTQLEIQDQDLSLLPPPPATAARGSVLEPKHVEYQRNGKTISQDRVYEVGEDGKKHQLKKQTLENLFSLMAGPQAEETAAYQTPKWRIAGPRIDELAPRLNPAQEPRLADQEQAAGLVAEGLDENDNHTAEVEVPSDRPSAMRRIRNRMTLIGHAIAHPLGTRSADAIRNYFTDPEKGKRRKAVAIVGAVAVAGVGVYAAYRLGYDSGRHHSAPVPDWQKPENHDQADRFFNQWIGPEIDKLQHAQPEITPAQINQHLEGQWNNLINNLKASGQL